MNSFVKKTTQDIREAKVLLIPPKTNSGAIINVLLSIYE